MRIEPEAVENQMLKTYHTRHMMSRPIVPRLDTVPSGLGSELELDEGSSEVAKGGPSEQGLEKGSSEAAMD